MNHLRRLISSIMSLHRIFRIVLFVWILSVAVSLYMEWMQAEDVAFKMASIEARSSFNKDLVYRRWAAMHGGVYVPPTEKTPPNPYLSSLPDRDVTTTDGRRLTLVNPAYMTRQVHEMSDKQYGAMGHITSLNPIRPENRADRWETDALNSFQSGIREKISLDNIDGQIYLRYMQPLITEKACLKCHAVQGYKEGDIRGGISFSVSYAPYMEMAGRQQRVFAFVHILTGLLGSLGIWYSGRYIGNSHSALLERQQKNRMLVEATFEGIVFSESGIITEVNDQLSRMFGYEPAEMIGRSIMAFVAPRSREDVNKSISENREGISEHYALRKDGSVFIAEVLTRTVSVNNSQVRISALRDITERRKVSDALKESEKKYRLIAENTSDVVWQLDLNTGLFTYVSPSVNKLIGVLPEELVSSPAEAFLTFDSNKNLSEWIASDMREFSEGRTDAHMDLRRIEQIRKDGSLVCTEVSMTYVFDDSNRPVSIIGISRDITARNRMEEDLWRAEKRYRDLIENVSEGIYQISLDGLFLMANTAMATILGYDSSTELIVASPDIRIEVYEDPLEMDRIVEKIRTEGRVNKCEVKARRRDGRSIWLSLNARAVKDEDGNIQYLEGTAEDVTDRKSARELLVSAKKDWEQTFNAVPDLIMIVDRQQRIQNVNEAMLRRISQKRTEVIGKRCHEFIHGSLTPPVFCPHLRILEEGQPFEGEIYDGRLDGHFLLTIAPLFSDEGSVRGTVHVFKDISDRKKIEQAVRDSELRYRTLFEKAGEGILYLSKNGAIMAVNDAFAKMHGYSRDEMLRMNLNDLDTPETARLAPERLKRIMAGEMLQFEVEHYHRDGHTIFVDVAACLIEAEDENLVVGFHRNITDRRRADLQAKMMQAKLIHADKMKSLGMLVSSVAHEINNPNNFIMFNSSILSGAWNDILQVLDHYRQEQGDYSIAGLPFSEMREAIPKLFGGINDGSHRIKLIVEKLRDFARADRGSFDGDVNLGKVVRDALVILQNQINKYTQNFRVSIDDNPQHVRGNHQQLEQVVINLIVNALQSLGRKDASVEVSVKNIQSEGAVEITVRDEGCGMSSDVLSRVTEPFFTTKLETGGTGLGLSISRSIVDDHKGTLTFVSTPGAGTTAVLKLPVAV